VFLVFGWVTQPLPSAICAAISLLALVVLQVYRGAEVRHELAKRLHL
jgi:negative regulator of sigma E activity